MSKRKTCSYVILSKKKLVILSKKIIGVRYNLNMLVRMFYR